MSWIREQFTFHDLQRLLFRLSEHVKAFQGLTPAEISRGPYDAAYRASRDRRLNGGPRPASPQ